MLIEHIAAGRYILDLVEKEERDLKIISVAFYKSNRSETLRQIITAGIAVYNQILEEGFQHDISVKDSLMIMVDELVGDSTEFSPDKKSDSAKDSHN